MPDTAQIGDRHYREVRRESPGIAGLNSKGHPPRANGVAQCVELFERLRGEACNQVDGARIALAHNIGDPIAVSPVTILGAPGANGE